MGEGRIGKSLERKAGVLTDRVLKLPSLRNPSLSLLTELGIKAAVSDGSGRAKFPLAPVTQNV